MNKIAFHLEARVLRVNGRPAPRNFLLSLRAPKVRSNHLIRGHITYLILAIEKITAERNGYVNELSYVSPDSPEKENNEFEICD